jgi:predicted metal-dependent phosphotriesterase family hydrolase
MAFIRTVCGDIAPEHLGITFYHEHLLTRPPSHVSDPDFLMDSEEVAINEIDLFTAQGGRAIVEMTPPDYGRNHYGLQRLSKATGVHIIAVTGRIKEHFSGPLMTEWSVDQLAEQMQTDIEQGMEGSSIRAGVLKAGSSLNTITVAEERVFRAAARVHHATGAPIATHTESGTMGLEQVALLTAEGVASDRIIIGHIDHKLDWDYHLALLETGVTIGYDQIGKEKYAPDSQRAAFVARVVAAGYSKQLLLSGDIARRSNWQSYQPNGGPGLAHILRTFVPMLRDEGVDDATLEQILVHNPARLLAFP